MNCLNSSHSALIAKFANFSPIDDTKITLVSTNFVVVVGMFLQQLYKLHIMTYDHKL